VGKKAAVSRPKASLTPRRGWNTPWTASWSREKIVLLTKEKATAAAIRQPQESVWEASQRHPKAAETAAAVRTRLSVPGMGSACRLMPSSVSRGGSP
jgi:hypothetical protein